MAKTTHPDHSWPYHVQQMSGALDLKRRPFIFQAFVAELHPVAERRPVAERHPVAEHHPVAERHFVADLHPVSELHPVAERHLVAELHPVAEHHPVAGWQHSPAMLVQRQRVYFLNLHFATSFSSPNSPSGSHPALSSSAGAVAFAALASVIASQISSRKDSIVRAGIGLPLGNDARRPLDMSSKRLPTPAASQSALSVSVTPFSIE